MDRRSLLGGSGVLLAAQMLPKEAGARARTSAITPDDGKYMQMAIDQAKEGDYPFGAVIVRDGRVLAFGRNSTTRNSDPTAHAEMMAIRAFLNGHEPEALKETTLYSSGEPCVMCMGAIIWCGVKRLVFAASIAQLASRIGQIDITAKQIANATAFSDIEIAGGFMSAPALELFPKTSPDLTSLRGAELLCARRVYRPATTRSSKNAQCSFVAHRRADQRHHPHEHLQRDLATDRGLQRPGVHFRCGGLRTRASEGIMGRDILLWLLGVPISAIILLHLFGVLHW